MKNIIRKIKIFLAGIFSDDSDYTSFEVEIDENATSSIYS
jgi:hypothetical protein